VSPLTFLEASTPGTGGFVDTPNQRLGIRHVLPIVTPDDLAKVAVADTDDNGTALRLGDVAEVVEDHQPLIGDAVISTASTWNARRASPSARPWCCGAPPSGCRRSS
jgi:Cu/Ag efflux pump CusA